MSEQQHTSIAGEPVATPSAEGSNAAEGAASKASRKAAASAQPDASAVVPERAEVAQRRVQRGMELTRHARELQRSDDRLSRGRALGFVALLALLGMALFAPQPWSWPAVGGALVVFLVLVVLHAQVAGRQMDLRHRQTLIKQSLLRIEDHYSAKEDPFRRGDSFADPEHPYAGDLDIYGHASLFEQMNGTHTQQGSETLARWLAAPASPDEIASRQQAARELAGKWRLREDLALVAARVRKVPTDGLAFLKWSAEPATYAPAGGRVWAYGALLMVAVTTVLGALATIGPGGVWLQAWGGALFVQVALSIALRGRTEPVIAPITVKQSPLERYQGLIALVESASFEDERLRALQARLGTGAKSASGLLSALDRWSGMAAVRHNALGYMLLQASAMWDIWVAYWLDAWRAEHGKKVADWLAALAEIEALCSLGGYADEHPDFCWPEVVAGPPCFEASALGHPLIAAPQRVDNDIKLDDAVRALMISGSNMSGKSTMLRSIGINAVLAQAGAPVRAEQLRMSPARIQTSMRVGDALDQGASHFFMEVRKLKAVVDAVNGPDASSGRVLFLLDEVLHGTNSRERNIGAKAVVRYLVEHDAIGAVSSHDLGLVELEQLTDGSVINKHFEDHIEGGSMHFDYRIKEGPVATSNALRLMRAVGIDVPGLDE